MGLKKPTCKTCKAPVRTRNGVKVSKYCVPCRKAKEAEKKEKHQQTKGYLKRKYKTLHKKAWSVFSEYVRRKDADRGFVRCYACGVRLHYKESQAGHYFHGKLDFDERNVHVSCVACNLYKSGNLAYYGANLVQELGMEGMEQLRADSYTKTYTLDDLERIIEVYTAKLEILKKTGI